MEQYNNYSNIFSPTLQLNAPSTELPALPMENPVPQPLTSKVTPSAQVNIPVSSTGAIQPSISSGPAVIIPGTPRRSTHSNKGILSMRFTPSKK